MKLEKKIHAVNEVQRLLKLNFDFILPQLEKFVGEKIRLVSGGSSKKFKIEFLDEKPKKFNDNEYAILHNVYLDFSYTTIWLKVKCSFKDNDVSCFYETDSIYIGDLDSTQLILKSVRKEPFEGENYNLDEVENKLNEVKELETKLSKLKSQTYRFKELY